MFFKSSNHLLTNLKQTYAHVLDKFMKIELEGLRKHLKNSKIIAFPKTKRESKSIG